MAAQLLRTARAATLVQQVIVYGSVFDALQPTLGVRGGLTVRLINRATGEDYPLARKRITPDATYAFFGLPQTAYPLLASQPYPLRVEASAPGYITAGVNFDVPQTSNQPAIVTIPLPLPDIEPIAVPLFQAAIPPGLPRRVDIMLNRSAVRLRGRVVQTANPMQGISGASVQVDTQTVTTNAQGYFTFPNPLPVTLSMTVTVTATGFNPETLVFEPNYAQALNELVITLTTQ
jgi:hypothetical protein